MRFTHLFNYPTFNNRLRNIQLYGGTLGQYVPTELLRIPPTAVWLLNGILQMTF